MLKLVYYEVGNQPVTQSKLIIDSLSKKSDNEGESIASGSDKDG